MKCGNSTDLFTESQGIIGHRVDDSQRFQTDAHITDLLSALLEAFFNNDTSSLESGTGFFDNVDQSKESAAICKEIIKSEERDPLVQGTSWK